MRLLAAALLASIPAAAGAVVFQKAPMVRGGPPPSTADCPRTTSYYAFDARTPVKPRKLGELPPANAYSAVLRHDGRCEVPVIIKSGVGGR